MAWKRNRTNNATFRYRVSFVLAPRFAFQISNTKFQIEQARPAVKLANADRVRHRRN